MMQNPPADERVARLTSALSGLFSLDQVNVQDTSAQVVEFTGRLLRDQAEAYPLIRDRFAALDHIAFLSQEGGTEVVRAFYHPTRQGSAPPDYASPAEESKPARINLSSPWVNLVLFVLTIASTLFVGAQYEGVVDPLASLPDLLRGVPFSFTLMGILGTHEMGHYIVARRHKAAVSLPYFVPLPFSPIGTMGAVIFQRSPFEDRKTLFDVGLAGPLAGLIVTVPLLIAGLATSSVGPYTLGPNLQFEGNSLFYLAVKYLVHGRLLPFDGIDVHLNSMAYAAWFGLFITFLNLLPIGQLDGGHVLYALLGRRAWPIAKVLSQLLLVAGLLGIIGETWNIPVLAQNFWVGWVVWGVLASLMRPEHPPPLNDLSRLGTKRTALGIAVVGLFFLLFMRVPSSSQPMLF